MPFQRGAPKGNRNRLKHGRYTRAATERRTLQRAQIRALKNLAIKATFVFHARRALRLKNERAHHIPPLSEAWRGVRPGAERSEGGGACAATPRPALSGP